MELQHINVKIPVEGDLPIDSAGFIGIFQRWVKEQHRDELLIDMADYRHVPKGPGVLCVGLQADYAMDQREGQWGLLYNRKAQVTGVNAERFAQAFRSAASACEKLESEASGLKFSRTAFECVVNDRALAVNSTEDWAAFEPELEIFVMELTGGGEAKIERASEDPRSRLGAKVTFDRPLDFSKLPAGRAA
jgi:hypothetical protein